MAIVTRKGVEVETVGELPFVGQPAPGFTLVQPDLSDLSLNEFQGKELVLNIFPSIDTPTCAKSVREFNVKAADKNNTCVVCVSADLPFALGRFCGAEGIDNVLVASSFRLSFGINYGVTFSTGLLTGLLSRAIVVVGSDGIVKYTQQVKDTSHEPDYEAALLAVCES